MRAVVLADTHLRDNHTAALPPEVWAMLESADAILHAGDVVGARLLDDLRRLAPVHAVLGNNDHALSGHLPATCEVELEGVQIAMIHDSGARRGRATRMRRTFPDADLVVFGHSHVPCNEPGNGQWLFNPGSATQRRAQPHRTIGVIDLDEGCFSCEIIALDRGADDPKA